VHGMPRVKSGMYYCVSGVQVVEIYRLHHHTCCLYLGSVLVDEYGDEPTLIPPLLEMLQVRRL